MLGGNGNGRDVVSMTEREKERRLAPIRLVEAYWHGLCGTTQVPLRSEVDPRGMEDALENAFLIERIAPSMAKYRVAGAHMSEVMGMQVAGMPLSTIIVPDDRERFGDAVERLFGDPAIVHLDLQAEGGFGRSALSAHAILMPLRSDFGEVSRGLGALVTTGKIGRAPRRFHIAGMKITPAIAGAPAGTTIVPRRPAHPPAPISRRPVPASFEGGRSGTGAGFAEGQDAFEPRKKGHLRLVVSND